MVSPDFMFRVASSPTDHCVEANGKRFDHVSDASIDTGWPGRTPAIYVALLLSDAVKVWPITGPMDVTYDGPEAHRYNSRFVERTIDLHLEITGRYTKCTVNGFPFPVRRAVVLPHLDRETNIEIYYRNQTPDHSIDPLDTDYVMLGYLVPEVPRAGERSKASE